MPAGKNGKVRHASAAREAWRTVHELVFSERNQERIQQVCEGLNLTPGLVRAMFSFRSGEPLPMKQLAGEWRCDASYVTSLVDQLEERGIVERRAHPTDRRAKVVALTAEGERTRQSLMDRMHEPPPFFNALSAQEVRELRDLLVKLAAAAHQS